MSLRSILAASMLLAGCAAIPAPPRTALPLVALPSVSYLVDASAPKGATLQGAEAARRVRLRFAALGSLPPLLCRPVGLEARLIASTDRALDSKTVLLRGARVADLADQAAFLAQLQQNHAPVREFAPLAAALPLGVIAELGLRRSRPGPFGLSNEESLTVSLRRRPGKSPSLVLSLLARRPAPGRDRGLPALEEQIVLNDRPSDRMSLAIVVPSPFSGAAKAIAIFVDVLDPPRPDEPGILSHGEAYADCVAALAAQAIKEQERPKLPDNRPGAMPTLDVARRALSRSSTRRGGLLALARGSGSTLTEDLALAANPSFVKELAATIMARLEGGRLPADREALGRCLSLLALDRILANTGDLPLEFEAPLQRFGGALATYPVQLRGLVEDSQGSTQLNSHLRHDNLEALDDGAPSQRALAAAWLAERKALPAGYHPLAKASERRAALLRASEPESPRKKAP